MINIKYKPFHLLALASALVLGSVYFIEHVLGHAPCKLCLYQRLPWFGLLIIAFLGIRWQYRLDVAAKILSILTLLTLLGSTILAGYHTGVEFTWWEGPTTCGGVMGSMSNADLKAALLTTNPVRCDEVTIRLFGGSLALWNTIVSGLLLIAGGAWAIKARTDV